MISVIICSANADLLHDVKANINDTIGVPFEILAYDNSGAQSGICSVYNHGVKEAKFDILCFVHEDVSISTFGWGNVVLKAFHDNDQLGLLGIAGSSYKSLSPSGWQSSEVPVKINFINLIQKYKHANRNDELRYRNDYSLDIAKVAVIDGVWFCGRKDVLSSHRFDDNLFRGFHGYDIDISLSVGVNFDVCVTFQILLTHFSEGNFGEDWVRTILRLHEKWRPSLPINISGLNEAEMKICEKNAFRSFVATMRKSGISSYTCLRVLNRSEIKERFGISLYLRLVIKCLSE